MILMEMDWKMGKSAHSMNIIISDVNNSETVSKGYQKK